MIHITLCYFPIVVTSQLSTWLCGQVSADQRPLRRVMHSRWAPDCPVNATTLSVQHTFGFQDFRLLPQDLSLRCFTVVMWHSHQMPEISQILAVCDSAARFLFQLACKLVQQSSASSRGFLATFWCSCSQTPECVSPLPLRASQPLWHDLHEWACSKPDHFILFSNPTDPEHWIQISNFLSCYFIDEYIQTCLHCLG